MIRTVGQLMVRVLDGQTVAIDFASGHPVWRVVETGEALTFNPLLAPWPASAIAVIQRDLLGAPYQLGAVTPPRGGRMTSALPSTRARAGGGDNPHRRARFDSSRPLQPRKAAA